MPTRAVTSTRVARIASHVLRSNTEDARAKSVCHPPAADPNTGHGRKEFNAA
jgi:hypothetical protein